MKGIAMKKRTMSFIEAENTTARLIDDLTPLCQPGKCTVAGSLRRRAPRVADIDIVCLPRTGMAKSPYELFAREQDLVYHYLNTHDRRNHGISIVKGGPRYVQFLYGTITVDLFMPLENQFGRILALRTGPAHYAKKMAARWVQMGYEGKKGELVQVDRNGQPFKPRFRSERSFFQFLNWTYTKPENRG